MQEMAESRSENTVHQKSINARAESFLRFINSTQRRVDVVWLNYEGQRVKYKTLSPGGFVDVNTFVTHPWIFVDSETKDRLVVKSGEVFLPEPYTRPIGLPYQPPHVERTRVFITIPLFSLRQRAMQVLRTHLMKPEDAYKLEIPTNLQKELAKLIKENHRTHFNSVYSNQ